MKCGHFGASSVYTIQPCTGLQCHFIQSHTGRVYVCLAVTCHLHVWQNDRDLLRATAVTRGWNGYRNKSQHRKLTVENKFLPPLLARCVLGNRVFCFAKRCSSSFILLLRQSSCPCNLLCSAHPQVSQLARQLPPSSFILLLRQSSCPRNLLC